MVDDLRAELENRNEVICIAGTGVSVAATRSDLASWVGLLESGVQECEKVAQPLASGWAMRVRDELKSGDLDDLLSAAEKVSRKLHAPEGGDFARWLRERVGSLKLVHRDVPDALHDLGVPLLTTNYDDILHQATGFPPITIRDPAILQVLRGEERAIVHLHGHWRKPESVTLGIRSYDQLLGNEHAQVMQQALGAMKTLLFVGCKDGLADPNFGALFQWMSKVFSGSPQRHYLLARADEAAALREAHPRAERLFVLEYGDTYADLAPFLRSLVPTKKSLGRLSLDQTTLRSPNTSGDKAFEREHLETYLNHLIREFGLLDLRGLSGAAQNISIPLDQVYVELQAERDNPTERDYDRRLLEVDVLNYLKELGLEDADEQTIAEQANKVLARDAYGLLAQQSGKRDVQGRPITVGEKAVSLSEVVRKERRAIILGDPGSGKTTLLKYLAVHYARAMRDGRPRVVIDPPALDSDANTDEGMGRDLGPARLPIYVRIASYAEARKKRPDLPMLDFLPIYWEGQQLLLPPGSLRAVFEHHIRNNTALILLDGLDEIASLQERQEIARHIEILMRAWTRDPEPERSPAPDDTAATRPHRLPPPLPPPPVKVGGNQVIVTSRIAGYHAAPLRDATSHYTVKDMSDASIDAFLRRWCPAVERRQAGERSEAEQQKRADEQREALEQALENPRIRRLAVNPLLLTLLALLNRSERRLPRLRIELYENATRTLVETWRSTHLTVHEVIDILGPVALWIHTNRPTGLATEREIQELVTEALAVWRGEDRESLPGSFKADVAHFIDTVRRESGLLLARGEGLYGFAHLTFQEYFVARQITRRAADAVDKLYAHLSDPRWREPLLLAVAQLAKEVPGELPALFEAALKCGLPYDELLQRGLLFAAAALPECARVPPALVRRMCDALLLHYAESRKAGRFQALRDRILAVYSPLRGSEAGRFAEEVLCKAIEGPDNDLADAASEIVAGTAWLSGPAVAAVVLREANFVLPITDTYKGLERQAPELFPVSVLPLRQAIGQHAERWVRMLEDPDFRDIVWVLYTNGNLLNEGCRAEAITRDSALTPLIVRALSAEGSVDALRSLCRQEWENQGPLQGEAGVLLVVLGQDLPTPDAAIDVLRPVGRRLLDAVSRVVEDQTEPYIFRSASFREPLRRAFISGSIDEFLFTVKSNFRLQGIGGGSMMLSVTPHETLERAIVAIRAASGHNGSLRLESALTCFGRLLIAIAEIPYSGANPYAAGAAIEAKSAEPLTPVRVAELLELLRSPSDEERTSAEETMLAPRPLSKIGNEVVNALAGRLSSLDASDPTAGYVGITISTCIGNIQYDDVSALDEWIAVSNSSDDKVTIPLDNVLQLIRTTSADVLEALCKALLVGAPRTQRSLLWSFGGILARSEQQETVFATLEAAIVSMLDAPGVDASLRPTVLWVCSQHSRPSLAFVRNVWRRVGQATSIEDKMSLVNVMARMLPRTAERFTMVGDLQGARSVLARLKDEYANAEFDGKALPKKLYERLNSGADNAARAIADELQTVLSPMDIIDRIVRSTTEGIAAFSGTPLEILNLRQHVQVVATSLTAEPGEEARRAGEKALVRLLLPTSWLSQTDVVQDREVDTVLATLETHIPDHQRLLQALVGVQGTVERWQPVGQNAASAAAMLCARVPSLVKRLGCLLTTAEEIDEPYERQSILAAIAELARLSPALLNQEMGAELRPVLLRCCRDADSPDARGFALAALSHLRRIGREVGAALLQSCRDTATVRDIALAAAGRFQHFDVEALDDLFPALTGRSAGTAYAVSLVLKELGTSRQAIERPELRDRIADALADSCIHPESNRRTPAESTIAEACYLALMEVAGT